MPHTQFENSLSKFSSSSFPATLLREGEAVQGIDLVDIHDCFLEKVLAMHSV